LGQHTTVITRAVRVIEYAAASRFNHPASLEYLVTRRSLSSGGHSADPVAGDDTGFAITRRFATFRP
jgi:hypothetical protein